MGHRVATFTKHTWRHTSAHRSLQHGTKLIRRSPPHSSSCCVCMELYVYMYVYVDTQNQFPFRRPQHVKLSLCVCMCDFSQVCCAAVHHTNACTSCLSCARTILSHTQRRQRRQPCVQHTRNCAAAHLFIIVYNYGRSNLRYGTLCKRACAFELELQRRPNETL